MSVNSWGRAAAELGLPGRCAGCGSGGTPPLCWQCAAAWGRPRWVEAHDLPPVLATASYRGVARSAVLAYKERNRRDLAAPLARRLAATVRPLLGPVQPGPVGAWAREQSSASCWLLAAPSRRAAARARGGQHMARLAERATSVLRDGGQPVAAVPALRLRRDAKDSVGLDPGRRSANLAGRVQLSTRRLPALRDHGRREGDGGNFRVLVDDVFTTGATARECCTVLAEAGLPVDLVLVLTAPRG